MSKDDEIQQLREKLARTEGERDALRQVVRDKVSTAPTPLPIFPQIPLKLNYCMACGCSYYGTAHACWAYRPQPYISPWNPPIYQTVTTSTTSPTDPWTVVNGYTPPPNTVYALSGKAIA